MKPRKEQLDVFLDIDGVLADFEVYFCHRFGSERRWVVRLQDRYPERAKEITNFIQDKATYYMLEPLEVGVNIAKWLTKRVNAYGVRRSRANVTILTSRPLRTFDVTKNWLKQEQIPYHAIEFAHDKVAFIKARQPDIIVDDIIDVCAGAKIELPDVTPVLVKHPYNDTPFFPRITLLSQFQHIYQQVAYEKLLDDIGGVGVAEDISGS